MEQNIFIENWEDKLALQFLKNNRCCKKAYICSPLSAPTEEEMLRNMHSARAYMYSGGYESAMRTHKIPRVNQP